MAVSSDVAVSYCTRDCFVAWGTAPRNDRLIGLLLIEQRCSCVVELPSSNKLQGWVNRRPKGVDVVDRKRRNKSEGLSGKHTRTAQENS